MLKFCETAGEFFVYDQTVVTIYLLRIKYHLYSVKITFTEVRWANFFPFFACY